jgi:hypothetical protein
MTQQVVDHFSNKPENLVVAAQFIGKSETQRRIVFDAIYFHKTPTKSVMELMASTGLDRRQVLKAGKALADHGIVVQTKKKNQTAYGKLPFFTQNKAKIQSLADNKAKQQSVQTKRNPSPTVVLKGVRSSERVVMRSRPGKIARLRVAFMTTNPDPEASLRTDIEMRQVTQAIRKSPYRESVDIAHYPAAQFSDLLDALNEFQPNVVHFSGHGGAQALVFDGGSVTDPEAVVIDFADIARALSSTKKPPRLVVLNACETVDGADVLLGAVSCVVAMSDEVPDLTATAFAAQLYSALAARQPIALAVEQGRLAAKMLGLPDSDLPTVLAASGYDPAKESI